MRRVEGNIVDVISGKIASGSIEFDQRIRRIVYDGKKRRGFILPGLIDAHIHIESTMLTPGKFAEAAAPHGTVGTVSDPHEIANVLGMDGIRFMMREAEKAPMKIFFAAPSCVPATSFETSGAKIGEKEIAELMDEKMIVALAEVMDYPSVIRRDKEVMAKIREAKRRGKQVDGHCPLLHGDKLRRYVEAGITTEHECSTISEAREKSALGMKIMIRQGSCEKNMDALAPIAKDDDAECFLVSDDLNARDLLEEGHVDALLRRIVSHGVDPIKAVRMISLYPILHYGIDVGLLQEGDPADMVIVKDLRGFDVLETWIDGKKAAQGGKALFRTRAGRIRSAMRLRRTKPSDFGIRMQKKGRRGDLADGSVSVQVIEAGEGQLITGRSVVRLNVEQGVVMPDPDKGISKIALVERYGHGRIGLGFIRGFDLKQGAIASSVAHDSHNIIAIGAADADICHAVNLIRTMKGGMCVVEDGKIVASLPLPIAGLMSDRSAKEVALDSRKLDSEARRLGSRMERPFMTLSFMALLVIPKLKLSDMGLFDSSRFRFTDAIL